MRKTWTYLGLALLAALALTAPLSAQLGLFSKEQRIQFSPDWKGDRFDDGRPKVDDETLGRLKDVTAEEAWGVLMHAGFRNQFEGN